MSKLKIIRGKHFGDGETVWLDGKHFIRCRFDGCKLGYAAKGDYRFTECGDARIAGIMLDDRASSTVDLLKTFGMTDLVRGIINLDYPAESLN